jgi:thiamine-monophosphate kinase
MVGLEIREEMLPFCKTLEEVSNLFHKRKEDFILGESDDYELLFTCAPESIQAVKSILLEFDCPVTRIGDIVNQERGVTLITKDSEQKVLLKKGWDHFR